MSTPQSFPTLRAASVIDALVAAIDENAQLLSEIDGAIGDGDHGINMRKGFLLVRDALPDEVTLSAGLTLIGEP